MDSFTSYSYPYFSINFNYGFTPFVRMEILPQRARYCTTSDFMLTRCKQKIYLL